MIARYADALVCILSALLYSVVRLFIVSSRRSLVRVAS